MVLLHGFIKKSRKTPSADLLLARQRLLSLKRQIMNEEHLGSTLDEFLEEEGLLAEGRLMPSGFCCLPLSS